MNVYLLDIAPLRGREREALALLPEERREKALRIRREEARLRSIGASLLLRAAGGSNRRLPAANTESRVSPAGRIFHSRTAARSPRLP